METSRFMRVRNAATRLFGTNVTYSRAVPAPPHIPWRKVVKAQRQISPFIASRQKTYSYKTNLVKVLANYSEGIPHPHNVTISYVTVFSGLSFSMAMNFVKKSVQ